ncbi:MAG: Hsp20/alpha crystallin family protein [Acaryochloris sp. RU_4_1]|nr:Hsp20/alpha crystallin family protein [Acaryochloris sp. RU_4_1]NJR55211.1 Hsp20/alpha crystallin family protein [Acaryochloris sp. CRU_2_0]
MTIVNWSPWQEIDLFNHQLNQLFDDALTPKKWHRLHNFVTVPAAEISETEDALYLKLELPGIHAEDLDIQASEKSIAIRGERKAKTQSDADGLTRSEFRYGQFRRVIPLPARIEHTAIKADYQDGILQLTLPKSVSEQNKVVKVSLDSAAA